MRIPNDKRLIFAAVFSMGGQNKENCVYEMLHSIAVGYFLHFRIIGRKLPPFNKKTGVNYGLSTRPRWKGRPL